MPLQAQTQVQVVMALEAQRQLQSVQMREQPALVERLVLEL
jgi:hypothetical protein